MLHRGETCQMLTSGTVHSLTMRNLTKTGSATVQFISSDSKLMSTAQLLVKGTLPAWLHQTACDPLLKCHVVSHV